MSMKLNQTKRTKHMTFEKLNIGDVFRFKSMIFIKVNHSLRDLNAISHEGQTWTSCHFTNGGEQVELLEAELTVQ